MNIERLPEASMGASPLVYRTKPHMCIQLPHLLQIILRLSDFPDRSGLLSDGSR